MPQAETAAIIRDVVNRTFVRHVDYLDSVASTNTYAVKWAADAAVPLPVLVLADRQTQGRGRGSNVWWSGPGALTFSLVLELNSAWLRPEAWPRIALAGSVAICDALESILPDRAFGIRWPNDVYLGAHKVCGVLPELHMARMPRLILGVGINVNNSMRSAPEAIRQRAASLIDVAGGPIDDAYLLIRVLQEMEVRFGQLATSAAALPSAWSRRCLLRGCAVNVGVEDESVAGLCTGIADDGALSVQTGRGVRLFYGGRLLAVDASAAITL